MSRPASWIRVALAGLSLVACATLVFARDNLPRIRWNDNDRPAGTRAEGVLTLQLEIVRGEWRFLGDDRPGVEVLAFREIGRDPENPGPLIRVPLGTEIRALVSNPLDVPLVIHGLSTRRVADMDSLVVPAGEEREARFVADVEGTYFYWGTTTASRLAFDVPDSRLFEDSQLNGALIVDPPGNPPVRDKVMILSIWFERPPEGQELDWQTETMTINGRPWPLTERLTYDLGDSIHWRMINLTDRVHPMHLHGFFFEVDAVGDIQRAEPLWPGERSLNATHLVGIGQTADISWYADRPGGWPFHCHISYHVVPNSLPGDYADGAARDDALLHGIHAEDPDHHVIEGMGGLVMGITVRPPEGYSHEVLPRRRLRLFVDSDSLPGERRRFGFALAGEDGGPPSGPVTWPGPTLVTWVGEPTGVKVINRIDEPTQVHWHGLEIDSYFDGVAGIGGYLGATTPAILPGDSFEMRITPPRSGSYMYHTHFNDIRQQSAGLYGGFIVLPAGEEWDPETDRVYLLSTGSDPDMSPLLNGSPNPDPIALKTGVTYRFRFMNITLFNARARIRLVRDGFPVMWRAVAKDGAALPERQQTMGFADRVVSVGETMDFEFRPSEPGEYRLEARAPDGELFVAQRIDVVAETASSSP
ncbi:MAG TPA: multicopper oxidase domain-containing protein [Gemmatimonadota bacterium]|nr:multicopper oxidase domain-containing protein [Gemmatimonadota bacterium]